MNFFLIFSPPGVLFFFQNQLIDPKMYSKWSNKVLFIWEIQENLFRIFWDRLQLYGTNTALVMALFWIIYLSFPLIFA